MAHSDTLIFLTNITWIFFVFLGIYFFFIVFFLPTFYKKFRARSWVRLLVSEFTFWGLRFFIFNQALIGFFVRENLRATISATIFVFSKSTKLFQFDVLTSCEKFTLIESCCKTRNTSLLVSERVQKLDLATLS